MSAVRKLADFMAGVRGRRKTMLLVSEGISYDTYDIFNNRSASIVIDETRDAIAAATRATWPSTPSIRGGSPGSRTRASAAASPTVC